MKDFSFITNAHPSFIENMYEQYLENPANVEASWHSFFKGFDYAAGNENGSTTAISNDSAPAISNMAKEFQVLAIIRGYRNRGHLLSDTNPIRERRNRLPNLDLADFQLTDADRNTVFQAGSEVGLKNATLQQIIDHLNKIYGNDSHIGFEFMHIPLRERRRWIRTRIEQLDPNSYGLSSETKRRILEKLNGAVVFEEFLGKKYVGQKRFSLEGGETTIAALDAIINSGADNGVKEVVIGMAHRGRLNVLANIMGKTYAQIFNEFEGMAVPDLAFGDGDVKYHLGFSSQVKTVNDKSVHLKLVPNPSHLESVYPVVEGFARAKVDILYKDDASQILPIIIHGDAAAVGQGVVYETSQMSQLEGYHTGGTIHFVINNQIGFTTDFDDARSSYYCSAAGNAVNAPIFHVNGDDPEAVVFVAHMAMEYRQQFKSDVWIDMVCYRKHGHNEGDDPKFTQPEMYAEINKHKNPRELYSNKLIERGEVDKELAEKMEQEFNDYLQERLEDVRQKPLPYEYQAPELAWQKLRRTIDPKDFFESPATGIERAQIDQIIAHLMQYPDDLNPIKKINRLLKGKQKLLDAGVLDWAMAELLAYGSILLEGKDVRMSGQDVRRGTFSHRHAVLNDVGTDRVYNRLDGMEDDQGKFHIYNSLLSEFAVLGFEYGYSMASPDSLVLWEGQFGDFYNGAQVMVDQYISAAESKWQRMSGLVMLLPHGYEGQGPEHSSARLERFLQMCAEFNMTVANVTTPANFFHLLRRQLERPFRKPLIVMSPKSLLRHPEVISPMSDFETGNGFTEVIDDAEIGARSGKKVKRLLLCTGKIYYDLLAKKKADKRKDIAIVRIEQLYPMPLTQLEKIFKKYSKAEIYWVQEEPSNMGSWQYIHAFIRDKDFTLVARKSSASPATGYKNVHEEQQAAIVETAFAKK